MTVKVIRNTNSGAIQLSTNFWLSEFTDSNMADRLGIENHPDPLATTSLFKTAALMEQIRTLLGNRPITISSGFRCVELNQAVGGSMTSEHMTGDACDFACPGFGTPLQICSAIANSDIEFGQLIWEGSWVHISTPGRFNRSILTAKFTKQPNGKTKATYLEGLPT